MGSNPAPAELSWRKSARSAANGACVEVAGIAEAVFMRDSKDPAGPVLRFSASAWSSFLHDTRMGLFDYRAGH
jgi:Domain of unknown function (DUF397)